jgi:hypothetical protein
MKEIFRIINELVAEKVIDTYAVGGAIAAHFYIEAFATFDIDIFFPVAAQSTSFLDLGPLYKHLQYKGYYPKEEMIRIKGWDVQFLPTFDDLTDEAVQTAVYFDVDGEQVRVMSGEYLVAIALKTGRSKDFARVKMFLDEGKVNKESVEQLVKKFGLEAQWQKYQNLM